MSTKLKLGYGNVYGGGILDYDYKHNFPARLPKIGATVREMSPAVFGMVEAHQGKDSDKKIAKAVGGSYVLARSSNGAPASVLYDKSQVRLVSSASYRFPKDDSKSVGFWRFQHMVTKLVFVMGVTHLSANLGKDRSGDRRNQIKIVLDKGKAFAGKDPLIIFGDFNETTTAKASVSWYLSDAGYVPIQKVAGAVNADRDSNNGKKTGRWIDQGWYKGPVTASAVKLWPTDSVEGRPEHEQTGASDHWGWPMATFDFHDSVAVPVETPLPPAVPKDPSTPPTVFVPPVVQHRGPGSSAPEVTPVLGKQYRWRTFVRHPNGRSTEISTFRGVPSLLSQWSSTDPFGDATASLSLPQVSSFEKPGEGDLWWLVPWAGVESRCEQLVDGRWTDTGWRWEGNIVSEEISDDYSLTLIGGLYMADNFQAAPFYPQYPVPYEQLLTRALNPLTHPTMGTKPLRIDWPADWSLTVPAFNEPSYLWFLRPYGVAKGDRWSGLTSRSTGSWEPTLTGYVQTLLSTMYTPEGDQWTVMSAPGRQPVLKVRSALRRADETTLVVYNGAPGVKPSLSRDFTQSANVIYGSGTDLAGSAFSGAQVSPNGESTFYEPFAALPQVYPASSSNPRLIRSMVRRESRLTFPQGIDELAARDISATQIRRFADPGYTGSITLESDPLVDGQPFPRLLIKAGGTLLLRNFRGSDVLFHVSQADVSALDGTVTLTVDTKFRDLLTVSEVRARTRDALDPVNLLQIGKASVTVPDLLKPWSYSSGSGVIPSGSSLDATSLFKKMPDNAAFPWTDWTKKFPPKTYPNFYVKVSKKGTKAGDRWQDNGYTSKKKRSLGVAVKAAQTGTIRLTQIAAYDRDGNVKPVKFHVAFYTNSGISSTDMPMIPKGSTYNGYTASDRYPFFPGAFEAVKPTGEEQDNVNVLLPEGADLVIGWGNVHDPAGYSPGLYSAGGVKTGKLVDESSWTFDTSSVPGFDKYSVANNAKNPTAGMLYVMIYCDDADETYFLGRLFNTPAGA